MGKVIHVSNAVFDSLSLDWAMLKAICPECDASVQFTSVPKVGHRLVCPTCNSVLAVISQRPIGLDWAFIEPFNASIPDDRKPSQEQGV